MKIQNSKELSRLASIKDAIFDLYWLAISLKKVNDFPDDIKKWPVEIIAPVDALEIKNLFSTMVHEVMNEIKIRNQNH